LIALETAHGCIYKLHKRWVNMKNLILFVVTVFLALPAFADFLDDHQQLFQNQHLCDNQLPDQVQAEADFKNMLSILRKDDEQEKDSIIEVLDYSAYTSVMRNNKTNKVCGIVLHDDCYSAYCE
jgi:hemerythrin superfamily protein